jgi:hypothetical protein
MAEQLYESETEDKAAHARSPKKKEQVNFFGALGLLLGTVLYLVSAFGIKDFSTAKWYESANLFPKIIGGLLFLFCLVYVLKYRGGAMLNREDIARAEAYLKSSVFHRLVLAIGLLAFYIFVLLRVKIGSFEIPYEAATFIYLFVTMFVFRTAKFAVWKIVVIAAVTSVVIGFCFTHGAKITLP